MAKESAEEKLARLMKANTERVRKYRKSHNVKFFSVALASERNDLLNSKLEELGITKKQFLENAIDSLLKE